MGGLTWKDLTAPEYVACFLESFLLMFLAGLGGGKAIEGGGVIETSTFIAYPSLMTLILAFGGGLLNGIRALRNLRAPAPVPRTVAPGG